MLFAVATPMHMMEPISAGTLSRVCVSEQEHHDTRQRGRQRRDDDERIEPRLKIDHDQQVDQHDGERQTAQQAGDTTSHGVDLAANDDRRTARQRFAVGVHDALRYRRATAPRSRPSTEPKISTTRRML